MVYVSQLSSYLYCPRKLFISNVLLLEEPPKEEVVKGEIWHKTYEWINKHEKNIVVNLKTSKYNEIADIYRKEFAEELRKSIIKKRTELKKYNIKQIDLFKEFWPNFDEEAKIRAWNVTSFIIKNKVFGEELWNKLSPKILSEQYYKSESLNLSGMIDLLEIYENNIYVPVELKSGKKPEGDNSIWPGHRIQLGAYLLLLEEAGKQVTEGVIRYKDDDEKRVVVMNSFLKEEVLEIIRKVETLLNTLELPPRVENIKKCDKCGFKEKCYDNMIMQKLLDDTRKRNRNN